MSDLMNTKQVETTKRKAERSGEVKYNEWNGELYVVMPNGDVIEENYKETAAEEAKEMKEMKMKKSSDNGFACSDDMCEW